jgi:phosphate transport system substrate-binding protein
MKGMLAWLIKAGLVVGVAALAALPALPTFAAPFDPTLCPTDPATSITGAGSTLQSNAQTSWISGYSSTCSLKTTPVSYSGGGSGAGITSQINRTAQYAGSDVPYSHAQWTQIRGDGTTHFSPVETLPVAVAGVVVPYNLSACPLSSPLKLTSANLALMYDGTITQWSDSRLVANNPGLASCKDAVFLSARAEASGTTFVFKDYLSKRNSQFSPPDNSTTWPAAATIKCRGTGNAGMVTCVQGNEGAIGYVDFGDVGTLSFAQVESSDGVFYTMSPGACSTAAAAATTPATTDLDWSGTSFTDTRGGYPLCTFTYELVFQNPGTAGVTTSVAQATNLKAYASYITADEGQSNLASSRYDRLPAAIQSKAQAGAAAINPNT